MIAPSRSAASVRRSRPASSGSVAESLRCRATPSGIANASSTSVRFILGVAGMLAIDGCDVTSTYCEQPHLVASSSDTRPGAVRAAAVLRTYARGVAALSDGGIVCLTCTGPVMLDVGLHTTHS